MPQIANPSKAVWCERVGISTKRGRTGQVDLGYGWFDMAGTFGPCVHWNEQERPAQSRIRIGLQLLAGCFSDAIVPGRPARGFCFRRKTTRRSVLLPAAITPSCWLHRDRKYSAGGHEELGQRQIDVWLAIRAVRWLGRHDAADVNAERRLRSARRPILDRGPVDFHRPHNCD